MAGQFATVPLPNETDLRNELTHRFDFYFDEPATSEEPMDEGNCAVSIRLHENYGLDGSYAMGWAEAFGATFVVQSNQNGLVATHKRIENGNWITVIDGASDSATWYAIKTGQKGPTITIERTIENVTAVSGDRPSWRAY